MKDQDGGLWVGEWVGKDRIVVFDPAAQSRPDVVVTYFDPARREVFQLLLARAEEVIRRIGDRGSHPDAVARYEAWRSARAPKPRARTADPTAGAPVVNLPPIVQVEIPTEVFERDWAAFEGMFPGGFESDLYLEQERRYKLAAHERIRVALAPAAFTDLPEDELAALVRSSFGKTDNLVFSVQHAALHGAMKAPGPARSRCLKAIGALLWDADVPMEARFSAWADALEALPRQGKQSHFNWPVATALPYLARPDLHCILKPTNARAMSARYGFELGYIPQPNPVTYQRWLCFVEALESALRERGARDRLDVQSFLWRVDPGRAE